MLLTADIGNTRIKFGVFDSDRLVSKIAIPTLPDLTAVSIERAIDGRIANPVERAIVCCVVPSVNDAVGGFITNTFDVEPHFVMNDDDLGLTIGHIPLEDIGTDRLVNSFAAVVKHGAPCIVCSFGTALTIDAVDTGGKHLGGLIAPGMETMARALNQNTARLPLVEITQPDAAIQNTTAGAIRSGIYLGSVAMFEGLVQRFKDEMGGEPKVIATGGAATRIASATDVIDLIEPDLLLDGLRILSDRRSN